MHRLNFEKMMPFFYVSGEVEGGIICPICATAMAYVHHLLSDRRFQVIEFLRFDRGDICRA